MRLKFDYEENIEQKGRIDGHKRPINATRFTDGHQYI